MNISMKIDSLDYIQECSFKLNLVANKFLKGCTGGNSMVVKAHSSAGIRGSRQASTSV